MQTGLARFVSNKLAGAIDGRLEIGSIKLQPFNAISLQDITIIDDSPCPDRYGRGSGTLDTLAHIGKMTATLSPLSLFRKGGLHIGRVDAEDVLFQLGIEPDSLYSINLTRIFRIGGSESESSMPLDTLFTLHKLNVRNARFRMVNYWPFSYVPQYGIDWGNLDLTFDLQAHDIGFHDARVFAVVDKLSAKERCGYAITHLSGSCAVGAGRTNIKNLHYHDGTGSRIYMPTADFNYYNNPSAWSNFLKDVELDLSIGRSHLVFGSISAYSGSVFHDCPLQAEIESAHFKGPVSNFKVTDMIFSGTECDVSGIASCAISGIPKTGRMFLDAELKDVRFTSAGLRKVLADLGADADVSHFAPGTVFTANGTAKGLLSDLSANLRLSSAIGGMKIDGKAMNISVTGKPIEFRAVLTGESLNLGKLLGISALGPGTFTASADGRLGDPLQLSLHNLSIANLSALGYDYSDVMLSGRMAGSSAQVRFNSSDPNALVNFTAGVDWKKQTGRIQAEIADLDLAALNIDTRGGKSAVSCLITAEQGLDPEEPAQILISDLRLTSDSGTYVIGDVETLARLKDERLTLTLSSPVFDAKYNGTSNIASLIKDARSVSVDRHLPAFFAPGTEIPESLSTNDCSLSAVFHDTSGILAFIMPGLSVGKGTSINLDLDPNGRLMGYLTSPQIGYNDISVNGFDVSIDNLDGALDCTVAADRLNIGSMPFNRAAFMAEAVSDMLTTSLTYDNAGVLDGGSELFIDAAFSRDSSDSLQVDIFTRPSQINIKGNTWELDESAVSMSSTRVFADGLLLSCGDQSISIDGGVRPKGADTLAVSIRDLDLDVVNEFLGVSIPKLKGLLDGDVTLVSPITEKLGLFAGLDLTGLSLDGIPAGDFRLDSDWDEGSRTIAVGLNNYFEGRNALNLSGTFDTRSKEVAAIASLDSLNVRIASPFIKSILSDFEGYVHGSLEASGSTENLKFASDGLRLDGVRGKVYYTKVTYILDGTVGVHDNKLTFNNIGVKDEYGGIGVLKGGMDMSRLSSPRIDAELEMNRLKAIDVRSPNSPIFIYGDLAVSGNGRVRGPFSALGIDADVTSAGSGSVNVPISSSSAASGGNLLTFKTPDVPESEAEELEEEAQAAPSSKSGVTVHARARVTPDVVANVEIDKESGHVLTAGGTADVVLDLNTARSRLQLKGDYLINKGKYLFNIPGVVSKEFDIKEGSSIKLNGDVMESTLNIDAIHNVKTSLNTLVADSSSVSSRRNVECGLNIGGKLRNPEVSFSINVPDLDPSTQMYVDAALSTDDKIQKQFVALLLLGTFIPEENSGIVNGTNMIYSNVGEIVAGQLNNILQKLEIPLDFGFGYQQDDVGTDLFDVAVSTQLFNNRLVVGGSVGNRRYSTSKSAYGDIVGDLDLELKLDNSGELRFKLFSHSADEYTSSLDFSQRNGLGFSYQKEYNKTLEFLRGFFKSRKKKAQEALDEAGKKKEMKVLEIE